MAQPVNRFIYDRLPLPSQGSFIRLVEILPAPEDGGCISCYLHEVAFGPDTPKYETLSYAWGTASEVHTITCNGRLLVITQTLHRALHKLRQVDVSRTIWIDQICINQSDDEEKSSQVMMMHAIYQQSSLTVAWLGDRNDHTDKAIKTLHRIAVAGYSNTVLERLDQSTLRKLMVERRRGWGKAKPNRSEFLAISVLLDRPWFSRMWVIQELGASSRVVLLCGELKVNFDLLIFAISIGLLAALEGGMMNLAAFYHLVFLSGIRQVPSSDERFAIRALLEASQMAEATDPRDKLFALYGLTSTDLTSLRLEVDYGLSTNVVYVRRMWTLMKASHNLELLELVGKRSERPGSLPSWASSLHKTWPDIAPLARPRAWGTLLMGRRVYRAVMRNALEHEGLLENLTEDEAEDLVDRSLDEAFKAEGSPDEAMTGGTTYFLVMACGTSSISTFELEDSGALRLSGQLIDKVSQTSTAVEPRIMEAADYYRAMDPAFTITEMLSALGGTSASLARKWKACASALLERDLLVTARLGDVYPTGEPVLTAYRRTITADSQLLEGENLEAIFTEWRKWFKPASFAAKVTSSMGITGTPQWRAVLGLALGMATVSRQGRLMSAMTEVSHGRSLAWTRNGYLALLPEGAIVGDLIILLQGARLPFVVRPQDGGHALIGPAYVHGIMNGEAYDSDSCGDLRLV